MPTLAHFLKLLAAEGNVAALADMDLAIGDEHIADDDVGDDALEMLAIEDAPCIPDAPMPLPMALPVALAGSPGNDVFASLRPVFWRGFEVKFDRFSSQNGILRAYGLCKNSTHRKCFRYVQTNLFPTRQALLAHLFAWMELGQEGTALSREAHQERTLHISEERTNQIKIELDVMFPNGHG